MRSLNISQANLFVVRGVNFRAPSPCEQPLKVSQLRGAFHGAYTLCILLWHTFERTRKINRRQRSEEAVFQFPPNFLCWRVEKEICCHTKMCLMILLLLSAAVGLHRRALLQLGFFYFPSIFPISKSPKKCWHSNNGKYIL